MDLRIFDRIFYEADGAAPAAVAESKPVEQPDPKPAERKQPGWVSAFPKEDREELADVFEEYHDKPISALAKDLKASRSKLSRAIVVPAKDNPDPAEQEAFRQAVGLPKDPSGYELKANDAVNAEYIEKVLSPRAMKLGLSVQQAKGVFDLLTETVKAGSEAQAKAVTDAEAQFPDRLKEHFKGNEEAAKEASNLAVKHLTRYGDEALVKQLRSTGLLWNPAYIAKLAELERSLGDPKWIEGAKGPGNPDGRRAASQPRGRMGSYGKDWQEVHGGRQQ